MKTLFKSYLIAIACLAIISCEKDEILLEDNGIQFPKLSGKIIHKHDLQKHPQLAIKIEKLSNALQQKNAGLGRIQVDTTSINLIQTDEYKSYTFQVIQDSIEKQSILKNYIYTIVDDTLEVQNLVIYNVLNDGSYDMNNIQFEQVWGDSIISQSFLKCGQDITQWYSYEDCYSWNCSGETGDGTHGPGDSCDAIGSDRAGTYCVTKWAAFTIAAVPCGGGGGGSIGGNIGVNLPTTGTPEPVESRDIMIPIGPNDGTILLDDRMSTIERYLNLSQEQSEFLELDENAHITEAVNEYLEEQPFLNQDGKQAVLDAIDVLKGDKNIVDLLSIIAHRTFNELTGKAISTVGNDDFEEYGEFLENVDPNDNLSLNDWQQISYRTKETYSIIDDVISGPFISFTGNLQFSSQQQESIKSNTVFTAILSNVKELVENNLPQTAEEWQALFELMQPLLFELGLSLIPGGGIALDLNDIMTQVNSGNPDYAVIALAAAGIIAEFIPWTKVAKFAKKAFDTFSSGFRIFKRIKRLFQTITSAVSSGKLLRSQNENIFIITENPDINHVKITDNGNVEILTDVGESILNPRSLKKLDGINMVNSTPNGFINRTNINNNSLKIKIDNPSKQADINAIKNGQDTTGDLSERLVDDVFDNQGYQAVDPNILGAPNTQGFDNVLIKRDVNGNIEDVIINESKQLNSSSAGFQMGSAQGSNGSLCAQAGGCKQMSDNWIDDVLRRMQNGNGSQAQLANELRSFGTDNMTLTVSGVDRITGELNIVRINNF